MDNSQLDEVESKVRQFKLVLRTLSYQKEDRNKEDIEVLKKYFKEIKLFKEMEVQLPTLQYDMLFSELKLESHKKHKTVFRYGSVYVLTPETDINTQPNKEETLQSYEQEEQEDIKSILAINPHMQLSQILKEGQSLGDGSLNQKIPRTATIVCRENTYLASLNSDAYYYIVEKYFTSLYEEKLDFLRRFPFLSVWSNSQLSNLLKAIKLQEFTKNQVVFKKYDPIIQDIEAKQEEPDLPLECYKQNIEEFYESFNMLNVQFNRSKKQELKKQQRVALLTTGQSFGLSEIAENQSRRQVTAICTSLKAEVFMIDKQIYLSSIKDKHVYTDFIKENSLKQKWRTKQLESSKKLFQKIEYRKFNIQTNRSVRQIKGLCEIALDGSHAVDTPRSNNVPQLQSARESQQSTIQHNPLPLSKIKGSSFHAQEQTPRMNNQQSQRSKEGNSSGKHSLSPRLENDFLEENQIYNQKNQLNKNISARSIKNNFLISKPSKPIINFNTNNKSENDKELNQTVTQHSNSNVGNASNFQSQRSILSSILRNFHTNDQKQNEKEAGFLSGFRISEFSNFQKDSIKSEQSEYYHGNSSAYFNKSNQSSNILKKIASSPKNFYEEELLNKLSINMTQKELKKKSKQAQKFNEMSVGEKQILKESLLGNTKGKYTVQTKGKNNTLTDRKDSNKTIQSPRKLILKRKKKSLEVIRSEKLESTHSLDMQQLFQTKDLTERFQQMVNIENEMHEQFGMLQPQPKEQDLKSRDSFPSSQSLRCFEKSYQDAQTLINKKQALDSLTQKQQFNEIKQSLNLNRDLALKEQIMKRASIQPPPTIPIYQSLTSFQKKTPATPGSSNSNKRLSLFFPASREYVSTNSVTFPQSMNVDQIQKVESEEVKIQEFCQANNSSTLKTDSERDLLNRKNEDMFQYLINKSRTTFQEKDSINIPIFSEQLSTKSQRGIMSNRFSVISEQNKKNMQDEKVEDNQNEDLIKLTIPLNRISSKQSLNIQLGSPKNIMNSPKNQINSPRNQVNSPRNGGSSNSSRMEEKNDISQISDKIKEKKVKPFIIDYNFIDSTRSSKYCTSTVKRNIPYDSKIPSTANLLDIEKEVSTFKYKRTLQIDCEENTKTPISQQSQAITPSRFSLLQTNPSTVNAITQITKSELAKKTPLNNTITQFDQIAFSSPQNAPISLTNAVVGGYLSNKSTASSSRPRLFKRETINKEIQQNKPSSKSNQRQFLYQLLNRNNYQSNTTINPNNISNNPNNNNNSKSTHLPYDIPIQPNQKSLYKFQESYYKSPINQSIITAYSSPRQLVFKINNKDSNKLLENSFGQGNNICIRKNSKNNLIQAHQNYLV